jgi:dTDP-4-dehydrorhamnose reductase
VLGAAGMLGHQLARRLGRRHEVFGTVRSFDHAAVRTVLSDACERVIDGVDATEPESVEKALATARPDIVLNAIGVIKQVRAAEDPTATIEINALFPHRLANLCRESGTRLLHFSTDCVFSGEGGNYTEADAPDATDLYGRSKLLGEVEGPGCLTLRTSILGRDLVKDVGLLEWFLSNRGGSVRGFRRAVFSGFPTVELARIVEWIIAEHPGLEGVYHVASPPIDKYDLLVRIRDAMELDIEIIPDDALVIDRSLSCARFREATGFEPRSWTAMVRALAEDALPYDEWRSQQ